MYDPTPALNSPSISMPVKSYENSPRIFRLPSSSHQDQALASLAISSISRFISASIIRINLRESIATIEYMSRWSLEIAN
jgi:hypothetical protein